MGLIYVYVEQRRSLNAIDGRPGNSNTVTWPSDSSNEMTYHSFHPFSK
jgi:hypothetical protein